MVTEAYIEKEESSQRKPAEIYHIWREGEEHFYYTSGDNSIIFESNTYTPVTIEKGEIEKNSESNVSEVTIQAINITSPFSDFIEINPVEIYWISISKLHRDQDPFEANVLFLGQIKNVAFSGVAAEIECVGFEGFLEMPIPQWRFQVTCNHKLFDANCTIVIENYKTTTVIDLDSSKTQLTSSDFGLQDNGYFTGGEIRFEAEHRGIIAHEGNTVTLGYKMKNLINESTVDAYPGCDGRAETCRDKFDNVINGLFFKHIPIENPAQRTTI